MEENWNLDIDSYQKRLCTCDGATLADKDLPPTKYVIRKLLPQGLALLSGSPKVGKSWLTLENCEGRKNLGLPDSERNNTLPQFGGYRIAPAGKIADCHGGCTVLDDR